MPLVNTGQCVNYSMSTFKSQVFFPESYSLYSKEVKSQTESLYFLSARKKDDFDAVLLILSFLVYQTNRN